jgi:hypothetical protein
MNWIEQIKLQIDKRKIKKLLDNGVIDLYDLDNAPIVDTGDK